MSSSPSILPGEFFFCFFSRHYNTKFQICLTKTLTVTDVIADKGKQITTGYSKLKYLGYTRPSILYPYPKKNCPPPSPPRTILKIIRQIHQNFSDYVSMDVQGDGVQWAKNRKNSSINFLCSNGCTLISLQFLKDPQASSGMLHLKICQNNVDF